tara:strand:+ start:41 stop:340 length:300 start_codon:yes stop_codon:yes gene_type:complete
MATTNKELLQEILEKQKIVYRDLSDFKNEQYLFNQKVRSILNSDDKTNQKGLVEGLSDVGERVLDLEIKNKVTAGKITISLVIVSAIGSAVWKIIGLLD